MPAASLADLTNDLRFHARKLYPADYTAQLHWLDNLYFAAAEDRTGAEVGSVSLEGSSTTFNFRGASPQDCRLALKAASEEVEATIAGAVTKSLSRPFGIRFKSGYSPAEVLDAS